MDNLDRETLDRWAAAYVGEEGDDVEQAASSEWYTTSPAAAFVLLEASAEDGFVVKLEIEDGKVEVYCGEVEEKGKLANLAEVIVRACYRCHNA